MSSLLAYPRGPWERRLLETSSTNAAGFIEEFGGGGGLISFAVLLEPAQGEVVEIYAGEIDVRVSPLLSAPVGDDPQEVAIGPNVSQDVLHIMVVVHEFHSGLQVVHLDLREGAWPLVLSTFHA